MYPESNSHYLIICRILCTIFVKFINSLQKNTLVISFYELDSEQWAGYVFMKHFCYLCRSNLFIYSPNNFECFQFVIML